MWTAFTRKKCYGGTPDLKWQDDHKGTEYSTCSTTLSGENSTSGAQYIEQVKCILLTGAIIACLENNLMVGNAINVNNGAAIMVLDEKEFGARARAFRFPKPAYSDENAVTGRDYSA